MKAVPVALIDVLEMRDRPEGPDVFFICTGTLADDFLDSANDGPGINGRLELFPEISRVQADRVLSHKWFSQKINDDE